MSIGGSISISLSGSSLTFESRITEVNMKLFETEKNMKEKFLNMILGFVSGTPDLKTFKASYDGKSDQLLAEYSKHLGALAEKRSENISQLSILSSLKGKLFNERVYLVGMLESKGQNVNSPNLQHELINFVT